VKVTSRYDIAHLQESQSEPGSDGEVMRNLRGIRERGEMELAETCELLATTERLVGEYGRDHSFTAADVCAMHRLWLGSIYAWAGGYRQVYLSKDGFHFASPHHVPLLMQGLEYNTLGRYTPCIFEDREQVVEALAVVHCELLLIHPFRDGNGRIARLLATLMALQAGLPLLDFSDLAHEKADAYFAAVHSGQDMEYAPMEEIFRGVIARSERSAASPG
jgi:cell filamentation protein